MQLDTIATVCAVRAHGEHGAIVRLMTQEAGLVGGYVRGGHSRRLRPIVQPGNRVAASLRSRTPTQLATLTAELVTSRAPLHEEPSLAAAIDWVTTLTAAALPEGQAYPAIATALDAVLDVIALAPAVRGWVGALARYELALLSSLGFGLSLDRCVATDAEQDLAWVSPARAAAVSASAARGHEHRLLPLPRFLQAGGAAGDVAEGLDALNTTGFFIASRVFEDRRDAVMAVRERLIERLQRANAPLA